MASTNIANQLTSTETYPNLPPPAEEEQISNRCIGLRGEHYVVKKGVFAQQKVENCSVAQKLQNSLLT